MTVTRTLGIVYDALRDAGVPGGDIQRVLGAVEIALNAPPCVPGLRKAQAKVAATIEGARGQVVTMGALLDATGSNADPCAMKVHVSHIRTRRPDIGACIQTVWGQGYRWDGPPLSEIAGALPPASDPRPWPSLSGAAALPAGVEPTGSAGGSFSEGTE